MPVEVPCGADERENALDIREAERGRTIAQIVRGEKGFLRRMLRNSSEIDQIARFGDRTAELAAWFERSDILTCSCPNRFWYGTKQIPKGRADGRVHLFNDFDIREVPQMTFLLHGKRLQFCAAYSRIRRRGRRNVHLFLHDITCVSRAQIPKYRGYSETSLLLQVDRGGD